VVILHEIDRGGLSAVTGCGQRFGELLVHANVVAPRVAGCRAEPRRTDRVPQEVVQEPQHPIGDPVVVAIEHVLRWREVSKVELDVLSQHFDPALGGLGLFPVGLGHGTRHPQSAGHGQGTGQRRHEPTRATLQDRLAGVVELEAHRPPIRGDDDRSVRHSVCNRRR
jgi:hypothetical protein